MNQPTLTTLRLILRPFQMSDAADVMRLAGDAAIADTTLTMPHPYLPGMAEGWIGTHQDRFNSGELITFAVRLRDTGELRGCVSLAVSQTHKRAEIGYWIGREYWNKGYCTEAARFLVEYGFAQHGLNKIVGQHFARNPASGRVMQKVGLHYEGTLRQHVRKQDRFEDLVAYSALRAEWEAGQAF